MMRITELHLRKLIREFLSSYSSRDADQSNFYTDFTHQEPAKPVGFSRQQLASEEMERMCPACHGTGTSMGHECRMCQGTGEHSHSAE